MRKRDTSSSNLYKGGVAVSRQEAANCQTLNNTHTYTYTPSEDVQLSCFANPSRVMASAISFASTCWRIFPTRPSHTAAWARARARALCLRSAHLIFEILKFSGVF